MADFAKVAKEVFEALRSFDYTVQMYNDEDMKVTEPEEARRFYTKQKNLQASIKDDDDNSSVDLEYGPSTHASEVQGLIDTLRSVATKYGLTFSAQQMGEEIRPIRSEAMTEKRQDRKMTISSLTEGMYGTSRSSYLRMENARMIVRHSKRIDDSMIGARGRCVESIFIENAAGERLLFPSTQIAPARAMTQHVNQGGTFADQVGQQIMRMTADFGNLAQASNFVANNDATLSEAAGEVREACRGQMRKMRKTFERLSRPSSYATESAKMVEQANMLNETGEEVIDETKLSELRQLLNDADLPKEVYECACKALDRHRSEEPMVEAEPPIKRAKSDFSDVDYTPPKPNTEKVMGYTVDTDVWERFKKGQIDLSNEPDLQNTPDFTSRYAELCYKLGELLPYVKDNSLAGLLHNVLNKIEDYHEGRLNPEREVEPKLKDTKAHLLVIHSNQKDEWKKVYTNLIKIAKHALRAAHISLGGDLATKNDVVREHMQWLKLFDPNLLLTEDGLMDPYSLSLTGRDLGDAHEQAMDDAIRDFDPSDFVESPEMIDVISGRNPQDPDENELTHDEIMDALRNYLQRHIETYSPDFENGFEGDTSDIADAVYDQAAEALQSKGFVVNNDLRSESLEENLTMDDVLIGKKDMGDSLAHEVTKAMVKDPDTQTLKRPDASYISRLHTIGNTTTGPDGQAY